MPVQPRSHATMIPESRRLNVAANSTGVRSSKRPVQPNVIVVESMRRDRVTRFEHRAPPVQVEQLVAHAAVVALDHRVLDRLAGLNELERVATCVGPGVQSGAPELGPVVDADPLRVAAI